MPTQFQRHKKIIAGETLAGVIASVADDTEAVFTDVAHGLEDGDIITISGMTNSAYNGIKTVANSTADTFETGDAFIVGSEADTGTWTSGYIEVFHKAARAAATYYSVSVDASQYDSMIVYLDVQAATGTVTLYTQGSPDFGTNWYTLATASGINQAISGAISAAGLHYYKVTAPIPKQIRIQAVVATNPVTFSAAIQLNRNGS